MERADVLVVGLGAMGSACAYQLAKRGLDVTGIDQYVPPHALGSTHGDTRITRQATGEGPQYVPLVLRSQELWREIEAETGADLFTSCGVLMMNPVDIRPNLHGVPDRSARVAELAESFNIEHEILDGDEIGRRYPQFQLQGNYTAYLEPDSGFVRPEASVSAQLELAQRYGATLRYGERVREVRGEQTGAVVITDLGQYAAEQVVVTAGPWVSGVLPELGLGDLLAIYRQVLYWWPIEPKEAASFTPDRFPVFIWTFGPRPSDNMYGFPAIDGASGGLKMATEIYEGATTPDAMRRDVSKDEERHVYDHCVRSRIPALMPQALRAATCLYTVTPDYHFVIDQHPEHSQIFLVSPCSGHGFKHSAAIGESVSQWVAQGRPVVDLSFFSLGRFVS